MYQTFSASTVAGSGRGHDLKAPTINLDPLQIPTDLEEGIYAGWATMNDQQLPAAIHYGPRPVFNDTPSFEVHVLDHSIDRVENTITVRLVERLRDVQDFASTEELMQQIQRDIEQCRAILGV